MAGNDGFKRGGGLVRRPEATGPAQMTGRRVAASVSRGLGPQLGASELAEAYKATNGGRCDDAPVDHWAVGAAPGRGHAVDPGERTPENLPAVISNAIDASGAGFVPNWHMISNLPRMVQEPIKRLGSAVFGALTDTPIEDIQMVSTVNSPESEVRALMAWIKHNGQRDDEAVVDFGATLPGYTAETQVWSVEDYTFLLVRDMQGHYVYGWPGGPAQRLESGPGFR